MDSLPEHQTMPGAFFSDEDVPSRNWTAPAAPVSRSPQKWKNALYFPSGVPTPQDRSIPGSFDTWDTHADQPTSPPALPSQSQQQSARPPILADTYRFDQASPYSLLLHGEIGNNEPNLTVRRTNGTRISQNISLATAPLRRNPGSRENTEISATMAGRWQTVRIGPDDAAELLRCAGSATPSGIPRAGTPTTATTNPMMRTSTDRAGMNVPATSKATMKNTVGTKQASQKPPPPQPSRDQEYAAQVSKLAQMDAMRKYWSNTGSQYDVPFSTLSSSLQRDLTSGTSLGAGGSGSVSRVLCNGVPLARKSIRPNPYTSLDDIRREVEHVRRLCGHCHVVKLVGTYLSSHDGDVFHILTFPVADCDMHTFLSDYETSLSPPHDAALMQRLSTAAGLTATPSRYTPLPFLLQAFLLRTLGCATSALQWTHGHHISHDDIKPANILLRSGQILLTDFGISRNRAEATHTSTEAFPGHTRGWTAPEKEEGGRHNPFRADVYSLGCVFMHVLTLLSGAKTLKDCAENLQSPASRREGFIGEHFAALEMGGWRDGTPPGSYREVVGLTVRMLRDEREVRPLVGEVNERLRAIGGEAKAFHGGCCRKPLAELERLDEPGEAQREPAVRNHEATTTHKSADSTPAPPSPQHHPNPHPQHAHPIPATAQPAEDSKTDDNSVTITPSNLNLNPLSPIPQQAPLPKPLPTATPPVQGAEMPTDGWIV